MAKELLSWTCPKCGKVITSLYQRQLDQNKKQHELKHRDCSTCSNVADACTPEDDGSPCGDKPEYQRDDAKQ